MDKTFKDMEEFTVFKDKLDADIYLIKMKKCCNCKEYKDTKEFHKDKRTKDGLEYRCGVCRNELKRNYYRRNKDKCKKAVLDWLKANKWNYVYIIQNIKTGRSYIGSSIMYPARKFAVHKNLLRNGKHHNSSLQEDWDKYGGESNFEFDVLEKCEGSVEERLELEDFFIEVFGYSQPVYNKRYAVSQTNLVTEGV